MDDSEKDLVIPGTPGGLVEPEEPAPCLIVNAPGTSEALLVTDHSSNRIPRKLDALGLSERELGLHIAWDIGIGAVAILLAKRLDAPAILAGYSRLVMDLNREPGGTGSFVEVSDGVEIPGNRILTAAGRDARKRALFDPYHNAIAALIESRNRANWRTCLICLHSFTPEMDGFKRPWHIGVLWNGNFGGIAARLLASLRADPALCVGDNEPYDARGDVGYTQRHHAVPVNMPNVLLEIRQDLIADLAGQERWAKLLAEHLGPILVDETLWAEAAADRS